MFDLGQTNRRRQRCSAVSRNCHWQFSNGKAKFNGTTGNDLSDQSEILWGCGKSSTCFHLAGALAKEGMRVLLVDADPQGSLSQGFLGSALVESLPVSETMAALFDDETYFLDYNQLPRPTLDELIQIVPANQHLARHNFSDARNDWPQAIRRAESARRAFGF